MPDAHTGASVVVTNPVKVAEERDRLAHEQLTDTLPEQRLIHTMKGLEMTVPYVVKFVVREQQLDESISLVEKVLRQAFDATNKHLNNYNPTSEVSQLNAYPSDKPFKMSPVLFRVMKCVAAVSSASGGSFDPACGPALEYIKNYVNLHGQYPAEEDDKLKRIISYSSLMAAFKIDFFTKTVTKKHGMARLDLGGISKGYTVDVIVEALRKAGMGDLFFDWGGDARATGKNPKGEPWSVGILRPPPLSDLGIPQHQNKRYIRVCTLEDEAIATSGDYENLLQEPTRPYTTLFDSKTHSLIEASNDNLAQVTVKNISCMYADALATAGLIKRSPVRLRHMLDIFRYVHFAVTDYTAYIRSGERVARMHEIATEDKEMRIHRIGLSLPARVIVIGGGLAGQCAAIEAASCGANVLLLEKEAKLGGNSAKATSGINGWGTRPQAANNIADNGKYYERDTYKSGEGGHCETALVKMLSVKSGEAIHWLMKSFGLPLDVISQLGGHSRPRTHRTPDLADGTPVPVGYTIMSHLEHFIRNTLKDKVTIMTGASVKRLEHTVNVIPDLSKRIRVHGVTFEHEGQTMSITADSVVLTTGGFGNDRSENSLLREFVPHLYSRPTTNGTFSTGDGMKMARQIGATLIDMEKVQLHPTGFIDPKNPASPSKILGPEALRGSGCILVNTRGERFVNELDLRINVARAMVSQGNVYPGSNGCHFSFCVLNQASVMLFGRNSLEFYWKKLHLFRHAKNVTDLAAMIGCPLAALKKTLEQYQESSTKKDQCPLTGKTVYPCVVGTEGPFLVAYMTPSIHYTMGGVQMNAATEVQSNTGDAGIFGTKRTIAGLFAAGEVTGGIHGNNRLGGNSLLECVVFGRIAGDRAATILQRKTNALSFKDWVTVVLREVREGDEFGHGSRVLRFNLPGATQNTGLRLGQFVAMRGEWDGKQLVGYYSPITLPDDQGVIGLLARIDKGNLKDWVSAMRPGDAVEMRAFGGLTILREPQLKALIFEGKPIRKLGMIAGGTGIAPMLQLIRAALKQPYFDHLDSMKLLYAAEEISELTYRELLENYQKSGRKKLSCRFVLNTPPPLWTGGVGFIDRNALLRHMQQPANDLLIVICGPPVMQRVTLNLLQALGHDMRRVRTVDEAPKISKM